ncbi:MAG: HEAT repeat domain-containing protein [Planctomycetes bacterium]|nr:HEAT repeat domain-containing protein [Planctomycetota bacterium]MCB9910158.1 HEAT repeat domain-containing protein [Planctomycetota bacterium]HPF13300.1 HEAT repeat domain-containing protein [Planctomycetota bacterium]HRV80543.1 HEAT repeat domain-containing protein [Planctomycetota bacterium]
MTINDHELVSNPGAWQLWWEFNQDRFLRYSSINTGGSVLTHGSDWEIGRGSSTDNLGGRLTQKEIQELVLPALQEGIQMGGSEKFVKNALMVMAKIGGEQNRETFEFFLRFYLSNGHATINETAAVAMGLACGETNYPLLASIAKDTPEAQELLGRKKVPMGMRAFAAYGMGFAASNSSNDSFRRQAVADLISILEEKFEPDEFKIADDEDAKAKDKKKDKDKDEPIEDAKVSDLRVAAMVSIGLIPLPFSHDVNVCICGQCKVPNPDTCFQSQVTYLMRNFTADEEFDAQVRAHTASTLGRLILAGAELAGTEFHDSINEIKLGVSDILSEALGKRANQPQVVQNSAIMALGLMGDADNEDVDAWIRSELKRAASKGGPLGKRFAMMSLAEVGSRRGQGEKPWAAVPEVRMELMSHLSRGRQDVRPWAGLALGVFGYQLKNQAQELDESVDRALTRVAKDARTADDLGAYGVAMGLRGSDQGREAMIEKLSATKDAAARSYVALGLGLSGNKTSIKDLQETLEATDREPLVQTRTGLALGLLGDSAVVEELVSRLEKTHSEEKRATIALALGYIGDKRSVEVLTSILRDKSIRESGTRDAAILAIGYMCDRRATPWRSVMAHGTNYLAETQTLLNGKNTGLLNLK